MKSLLLLILLNGGIWNHKALACDCGPRVHPDMGHSEWVKNNSLIAGAGALFSGGDSPASSSGSPGSSGRSPASKGGSPRSSGFSDDFFNSVGRQNNAPEPDENGGRRPRETR